MVFVALLPPATKLGQGYIFTGVCDSVHRGGGGEYLDRYPPDQIHPPRTRYTPGTRYTPQTRYTSQDLVHQPGQVHPRDKAHTHTHPRPCTPPRDQVHLPPELCMLGDTGNKRAVRILLECILVIRVFFSKHFVVVIASVLFLRKKLVRYTQMFVVSKLVVSGT